MKHVGDLVNVFPLVEQLAEVSPVELATGPDPYRAMARNDPWVHRVWAPFRYQRRRASHVRLIERVLRPFYRRVILLDHVDPDWWRAKRHLVEILAERCGVPAPVQGRIYLSERNRSDAARYLSARRLGAFIYVAQVIRHARPGRSWPLGHHHQLYRLLREHFPWALLIDTAGADETDVGPHANSAGRLDLLTAAAVIERAQLFVGIDSGLTHVAAALGVPTVSIHVGYPPECSRALGAKVTVVRQRVAFDDPALTSPEEVFEAVKTANALGR
jgi:Glycosyltransferase family 9 (heptosyltransferase)